MPRFVVRGPSNTAFDLEEIEFLAPAVVTPDPANRKATINTAGGINSFTTTTANFTQPAVGPPNTVIVSVANSAWAALNQFVFINDSVGAGGIYKVVGLPSGTQMTLENTGSTINSAPAATILSGAAVTPAGPEGPQGTAGTNGTNGTDGADGANAYDTTTANFTQPAEAATVTVVINDTAWLAAGMNVFIADATGDGGYYEVASITNGTDFVATNLAGYGNSAVSTTIDSGAAVVPAGVIGPVKLDEVNVFTKAQRQDHQVLTITTGTATPDASEANFFRLSVTEVVTLANPTNAPAAGQSQVLNFVIIQDATGYAVTLGSKYKAVGTIAATANAKNVMSCVYDQTLDQYLCSIINPPA